MEINILAERQRTKTQRHILTPLQVAGWEARRYGANKSSWQLAITAFGLFVFITWPLHHPSNAAFTAGTTQISYQFSGTSAYGMILLLFSFSFLLALLLPLLCSAGVAHDVKQRTHELLMTTPVQTWAYIIGRYLFYLLASIGLALLMLAAILLMGFVYHLTDRNYLAPQVDAALGIWVVAILPTTIVVSSLSFVLGTLIPRHANLAALGVIIAWYLPVFVLLFIPASGFQIPLWYKTWEPTNIGMGSVLQASYSSKLDNIFQALATQPTLSVKDGQNTISALQALEQKMPELLPWLVPHLVWASVGLALVLCVAFTFKRFRNVLNG